MIFDDFGADPKRIVATRGVARISASDEEDNK
jgi:hypothetical protein